MVDLNTKLRKILDASNLKQIIDLRSLKLNIKWRKTLNRGSNVVNIFYDSVTTVMSKFLSH
jgi:hypothetical protein